MKNTQIMDKTPTQTQDWKNYQNFIAGSTTGSHTALYMLHRYGLAQNIPATKDWQVGQDLEINNPPARAQDVQMLTYYCRESINLLIMALVETTGVDAIQLIKSDKGIMSPLEKPGHQIQQEQIKYTEKLIKLLKDKEVSLPETKIPIMEYQLLDRPLETDPEQFYLTTMADMKTLKKLATTRRRIVTKTAAKAARTEG